MNNCGTAQSVRPVSEVEQKVQNIEIKLADMDALIAILASRLSMVTCNDPASPSEQLNSKPQISCELSARLESIRENLALRCETIQFITDRLMV